MENSTLTRNHVHYPTLQSVPAEEAYGVNKEVEKAVALLQHNIKPRLPKPHRLLTRVIPRLDPVATGIKRTP